MRAWTGTPIGFEREIIGRVTTRVPLDIGEGASAILVTSEAAAAAGDRYLGAVTTATARSLGDLPGVAALPPDALAALHDGDVLTLSPDGTVHQVWDGQSRDNVLLISNDCDCRCIMCPQPRSSDPPHLLSLNRRVLELGRSDSIKAVALTGGEPTLRVKDLCTLLELTKSTHPRAEVAILTNGRAYSDEGIVERIARVQHACLVHCVSLHADTSRVHDRTAGVRGCFDEVVVGLHNLARWWQRVEIRVVLTAWNSPRLVELAEFIYRNFPYVSHVAFMGLEVTWRARDNAARIWIEPGKYAVTLAKAVRHLSRRGLDVSVYNVPLCVLPVDLHSYCRDSISDWKKAFLPVCAGCSLRPRCGGVFATSAFQVRGIHAIPREEYTARRVAV